MKLNEAINIVSKLLRCEKNKSRVSFLINNKNNNKLNENYSLIFNFLYNVAIFILYNYIK